MWGSPLPADIANAPRLLDEGLQMYLGAFFDLDSERTDLNQIPFTSMLLYGQWRGFEGVELDDFLHIIREMDAFHINRLAAQRKTK